MVFPLGIHKAIAYDDLYFKQRAVPGEYDGRVIMLEMIDDAVSYAVDTGMHTADVKTFLNIFATVCMSIVQNGKYNIVVLTTCTVYIR